ncbi:MAG: hypothetical protein ABJG78_17410 [Cyclobacteriaceae bacterium]
MSQENLVSIQLTPENVDKMGSAVDDLREVLEPVLISLTPDKRRVIPKMGDGTEPFVAKALDYAISNPEFAPPYLNVPEMEIDLKAVNDLLDVYRPLLQLMQKLDDSIMLSGSEAYVASLAYYNSVKMGAKMNIGNAKSIYNDLKKRFVKSSSPDESSEEFE